MSITTEDEELYNEFHKRFPLEKMKTISLEEYTNLEKNSFCYWVENKLNNWGNIHGATSYKFGIYRWNKEPEKNKTSILADDKYAWQDRFGKSPEEAFENVRNKIVKIIEASKNQDYKTIDDIDISEMFKWKIAFLYSEKKLINWFSRASLLCFAKYLGKEFDENTPTSYLQSFLMKKKGDKSLEVFSEELLPIWQKYKQKINGNVIYEGNKMTDNDDTIEQYKFLLLNSHNLILHGAPGTGKTHLAKDIAAYMHFSKQYSDLSDDEKKQLSEYVGFVQFHPSYDYTDFVEGLRPVNDGSGQIGFERKDGVFKKFCEKALLSTSTSNDFLKDLNDNPTIWKVSLEGTGDNPTRKDCLENGYIRIGWHEYGDVVDFSKFDGYTEYGGSNVLVAFQHKMRVGDIVLSCWSSTEIDAIGIVTGEYEYRSEGGDYPRYRAVKWLVKGIRENIVERNSGKTLTLASVYKLSISMKDVLEIVSKYQGQNLPNPSTKNFVFIIDEINRGEMSKIFGELFFSIDPGYRGKDGLIKTQYQNLITESNVFYNGFYVPENVYIIGTMNDIDRNVESMDFAFRRRFTFKEITAKDTQEQILSTLDDATKEEATKRMDSLNDAISKVEGLSSSYHIGGAYFLKLKDLDNDFGKLWEYHLEGLLREYLRGMENAEDELKKLKEAYKNDNPMKEK